MPKIEIEESAVGGAVIVEAAGRLIDACDDARAAVSFSCRSARCATCLVDVIEGRELLDPMGDEERETLASKGARDDQRLACQVTIRAAPGRVRLRWAGG